MVDAWVYGLVGGSLAMLLKPLFLQPLAKARASPWTRWAARLLRVRPEEPRAMHAGWALLAAYGGLWGLAYAYWDAYWDPAFGSYVLRGIAFGMAAFAVSLVVLLGWSDVRRHVDRRLWVGLFLTDVLYGATLGMVFVVRNLVEG